MRTFDTGATRDTDTTKIDPEGFLSPQVIQYYCEYMHKNRVQANGQLRASDNWQHGIPRDVYMKSAWRHFLEWWWLHRTVGSSVTARRTAICALLFNAMGYLFEDGKILDVDERT